MVGLLGFLKRIAIYSDSATADLAPRVFARDFPTVAMLTPRPSAMTMFVSPCRLSVEFSSHAPEGTPYLPSYFTLLTSLWPFCEEYPKTSIAVVGNPSDQSYERSLKPFPQNNPPDVDGTALGAPNPFGHTFLARRLVFWPKLHTGKLSCAKHSPHCRKMCILEFLRVCSTVNIPIHCTRCYTIMRFN